MINAAHSMASPGAVFQGRTESADCLRFGRALKAQLRDYGIEAVLIDSGSPAERVERANAENADIYIALHRGAGEKKGERGGISATLSEGADSGEQYSAFYLLQALCRGFSLRYGGVHCKGEGNPHKSLELITAPLSLVLELGFINSPEDNLCFDKGILPAAALAAAAVHEILREGEDYEINSAV